MTAIIYWSGTGNTEAMATAFADGMKESGAEVSVFSVDQITEAEVGNYEKLAFGCPSMGDEVLEEMEFEPFFTAVEGTLAGKKVALFGSYGWGDGEWMRVWCDRTKAAGALLYGEGLIQADMPEDGVCEAYGKEFAAF